MCDLLSATTLFEYDGRREGERVRVAGQSLNKAVCIQRTWVWRLVR